MIKEAKASQLYKLGQFNVCNMVGQPDGSTVITCDSLKLGIAYEFRAKKLGSKEEELLIDPTISLEGVKDADLLVS